MDPLHLFLWWKPPVFQSWWFDSYIRIHTHTSHTLSLWLFHNCYSQGQNDSSRLFSASPLPTPPAFPAGQEAPQLCSQLSHHLICQILETTLMWKSVIAVLCCNKKGCFLKDHYTSTEPLWAIPHPLLTWHLGGDFPLKLLHPVNSKRSQIPIAADWGIAVIRWLPQLVGLQENCLALNLALFWQRFGFDH